MDKENILAIKKDTHYLKKRGRPAINYLSHYEAFDIYLNEIDKYPLLSREEEITLAKKIHRGDKSALEKLVSSNLRFVVKVAKRYANMGIPLSDLVSEGNLGLMRAANKYDENKNARFVSYAIYWIRQAILTAFENQSKHVRLPRYKATQLREYFRTSNELSQRLMRAPKMSEVLECMEDNESSSDGNGLNEEDAIDLFQVISNPLRLYNPSLSGSSRERDKLILEKIPDNNSPSTDAYAFDNCLDRDIKEQLNTLKERESLILILYFGLGDREPMTLEEIGSIFGISRERVRQIRERALERMRHPSRRRKLETWL